MATCCCFFNSSRCFTACPVKVETPTTNKSEVLTLVVAAIPVKAEPSPWNEAAVTIPVALNPVAVATPVTTTPAGLVSNAGALTSPVILPTKLPVSTPRIFIRRGRV